ncbi:MAG: hypothetical protein LBG05_10025 [Treponema sp.]|jgi:hypothetical protein|nr:hypothetical protein [Treponema sp.]
MQKIFLCGILGVVLLTVLGCRDYLDFSNEDEKGIKGYGTQQKTTIVFDNRGPDNIVPVTVYSNADRSDSDSIVTVSRNSKSSTIEWSSGRHNFYITYDLYFRDTVSSNNSMGIEISYTPSGSNGTLGYNIATGTTTTISIPSLYSIVDGDNVELTTNKYIVIENKSTQAIELMKGNTTLQPIQGDEYFNPNTTAVYKLSSSDNITSYSISNKSFPTDNPVQSGHITFFAFNGSSISYRDEKAITINNLSVAP